MTDERKRHIERDIMAHLIALHDLCKEWSLLDNEETLSISIHEDFLSAFVLADNGEYKVRINQRLFKEVK